MKKIFFLIFTLFFVISCSKNDDLKEENIVSEKTEKQKTILALWDSLTAWYWVDTSENYPTKLEKKLLENNYNYKVINAWISWDTSSWLKSRVSLYLDQNPEIVIIVIWWNDGLRWLPTTELEVNILSIIESFPAGTKIVLWGMDIPINLWLKYRNDFKNVYKNISKQKNDIYFLPYFLEGVWWVASLNISDMIHPNSAWYDIIVQNLYDFLIKNDVLIK